MAEKHKAATQVQIARTQDESAFQSFVEKYWKIGLLLFVGIAGFVLFRTYKTTQNREEVAQNWSRLSSEVSFGSGFSSEIEPTSAAAMQTVAAEFQASPLGGWAKLLEAKAHLADENSAAAIASLKELGEKWPNHPASSMQLPLNEGSTEQLASFVEGRLSSYDAWKTSHGNLFSNPSPAEGSTQVVLTTSRGDLTVMLDAERAPRHVENFLKHCREGFYDNTKFHRVLANMMIQGGDPNTKEGEAATWGSGGPGYKLDPEENELKHFKYVLSAAKQPGDTESSGSQFFITTNGAHHLDGEHVVFGVLVDGFDTLEDIASAPVEGDRPVDPVVLQSTRVAE